jgi:hypothetical protein
MLFNEMIAVVWEKLIMYLLLLYEEHKRECAAWKNSEIPAYVQMALVHCSKNHVLKVSRAKHVIYVC